MNEQLASMIARNEYTQHHTSAPLLEFDRQGDGEASSWLEQGIGALPRLVSNLISSLKDRNAS